METKEKIIKKYIPNGCINLHNYKEEIDLIGKAMEEYVNQTQKDISINEIKQSHFFQTDNYAGLTPTICYKIKRFFTHKTF